MAWPATVCGSSGFGERDIGPSAFSSVLSRMEANTITRTFLAVLARLLSGATARWIDCEPDTCQRVYFANHTSHLDALVLWSSLPGEIRDLTRPVAAKDYWSQGAVRRYIAAGLTSGRLRRPG